jgi:serine/threonine protein phosphatase PrpC
MRLRYAVRTDVGMKRMHNEDRFAVFEEQQVFLVADGMGGHAAGDLASKLAADAIGELYRRSQVDRHTPWPFELDPSLSFDENRLACAIKLANNKIFEAAATQFGRRGMGTTVVVAAVEDEQIVVVSVRTHPLRAGDLYLLCTDGLSGMLADHDILRIANEPAALERAVAELVETANRHGGDDNVTVLLLQCLAS